MIGDCVAVAYSGGRDSSALLHAVWAVAEPLGIRVVALHVHHGLSSGADAWLSHCEHQCQIWSQSGPQIELISRRIDGSPASGESVEAWARKVRYRALREMAVAQGASLVLLAHHRQDQAETFLLQALRGAGVAGLAGMPESVTRDGIVWMRPWLHRPRDDIERYVAHHRIQFVEDDSNDNVRFARNRLRAKVWSSLVAAFPGAGSSLAASAEWAQEARSCLNELAEQDMGAVLSGARDIDLVAWFDLSQARRSNVLRAWLRLRLGASAPASLVRRLMSELDPACIARWAVGRAELRAYRGALQFVENASRAPEDVCPESTLSVTSVGEYLLPGWGGRLAVTHVENGGVPLAWLGRIEIRQRSGAERFQASEGRPARSLKKQFQDAGVPAWARDGPLLYSGGQLVFVPQLGIDARVRALPGQAQVGLQWVSLNAV